MMVRNGEELQRLINSGIEVGKFLTPDQARMLNQSLNWYAVTQRYGLDRDLLYDLYNHEFPLGRQVYNILIELNGGVPNTEPEEDIWL